jgi:hypothetical protein
MSDHNYESETVPQMDDFELASQEMLYGDPSKAAGLLRRAIYRGAAEMAEAKQGDDRLRAEQARSSAALEKWRADNVEFINNEAAVAAGEKFCYGEQIKDLERLGLFDRQKFREQNGGADATFAQIGNMHLRARSEGFHVRPVEEILDTAADRVTQEMPHVRRRAISEEENRKRAIRDRMKVSANSQGKSYEEYMNEQLPSRQPNVARGEPVTTRSIQQQTLESFGHDNPEADAALLQSRKNAIAQMQNRTQGRAMLRQAPQPEVEVTMQRKSFNRPGEGGADAR